MEFRQVFIAAFLALFVVASFTRAEESESDVVTLTKDNFEKFISEHDMVLVKFYAPWCTHCKKMAPHYETAATRLKEKGSKAVLAKVDATQEEALAQQLDIKGFPTLKFFKKKVPSEYNGGRTDDLIVEWVEMMTGPAVLDMTDGDVEEKLKEQKEPIAYVGNFKSKDNEFYKLFEGAAEMNRQHGKFMASVKDTHEDRIIAKRDDDDPVEFKGKTKDELLKFIQEERFPLVGPINGDNYETYSKRDMEMIWFCGDKNHYDKSKPALKEVAAKYRTDYAFVWLDTEQFKKHAEDNLGLEELPGLVYVVKKGGRYVYPGKVGDATGKDFISFFEDIRAGKIEKVIRSEEDPETNDKPVKVVVAKRFEDWVFQKDKDVMLQVYAPWCGHCKSFEPVYNEFAEKLKPVEHIVIAKMDGTANESAHEEFEWAGFPTVFFVKAGEKTPIKYESGRTVEDLMKFVKENSSKSFTLEPVDDKEEL